MGAGSLLVEEFDKFFNKKKVKKKDGEKGKIFVFKKIEKEIERKIAK